MYHPNIKLPSQLQLFIMIPNYNYNCKIPIQNYYKMNKHLFNLQ